MRVRGLPPEWVGFFLCGLLGWWIGGRLAHKESPARLAGLRGASAEDLARRAGPDGTVRLQDIETARATVGRNTSLLRVTVRGRWLKRRRIRLDWTNLHLTGVDLPSVLAGALGPRVVIRRAGWIRRAVGLLGWVLLGLALLFGIVSNLGGSDEESGASAGTELDAPGYPEARAACMVMVRLTEAVAGREATAGEAADAARGYAEHMERAAGADLSFLPAATAARRVESWLTDTTGRSQMTLEESDALDADMNAACDRAFG